MAGNFFVPGGGAPAAWGAQEQAEVNVQMAGNNGARAGRYAANQAPMAAGDRQDFDELNQAITNIIEGDMSNSVAVQNPARTGALRVTANNRGQGMPPATSAKHYHAKTTYTKNFTYITLYTLSILCSLVYIIVRIWYIATGKLRLQIPFNQPVVETGTCPDPYAKDCNSLFCGQNPDVCGTILAGDLLRGRGVQVEGDNVIEPDDVNAIEYKGIKSLMDDFTYSYWWSIIVLAAEIGGFILVHLSQQMFIRQDTKFFEMEPERINQLREITTRKGPLQRINVMVCTYNEPAETVKSCVEYLLASESPVYCEKIIYIGDDGAKKKFQCSEDKRVMCEDFHKRGYTNVIWVGDRKALPHQLNGKSSNINHMVLRKMYPDVEETSQVPFRDVLMVMDCDHLVEPEFFAKACAVMLDRDVAVCLIPQSFHNEVQPDCFDNTNYNFMFRLMPYYFGAGCCFVTGTNVMIRARAAFMACRFDDNPHGHETQNLPGATQKHIKETLGGDAHRQLFSEVLVAEDIDLGSRVHTLGFKSVFLAEVLAKGEVPRGARDIWKQRSRWAAAAHMYILDPSSVFWRKQKNMSYWQKSLYWIPMVLHWTLIWAEPIMFSMPIICLAGNICPYGIDLLLWITHFAKLVTTFLISSYADTLELSRAAIYGQTMARVLFFTNVKAVLNTMMVYTGWKRPGAFKVTTKAGGAPTPAGGGDAPPAPVAPEPKEEEVERDTGGPTIPKVLKGLKMHRVHGALSKVTETRKKCMPFEGTFDFWVLLGITLMNLTAVGIGIYRLGFEDDDVGRLGRKRQALFSVKGCQSQNVQLIALVFAFIEATPGLLFIMYMFVEARAAWVMKIWVPVLIGTVSILCILIEFRVGVQYIGQLANFEEYSTEDIICGDIQKPSDRE